MNLVTAVAAVAAEQVLVGQAVVVRPVTVDPLRLVTVGLQVLQVRRTVDQVEMQETVELAVIVVTLMQVQQPATLTAEQAVLLQAVLLQVVAS